MIFLTHVDGIKVNRPPGSKSGVKPWILFPSCKRNLWQFVEHGVYLFSISYLDSLSIENRIISKSLARHWSLGSLLVTTATSVFGPYFIGTPHQRDNCVVNNMCVLALLCVLRITNTCLSYMLIVYTWSSLNITRTQARAWHLLGTWRCWLNGCQTFAWDIVKYAITSSFDWGQNPLFISNILYQVMAWRPFGARPLSDIICIIKFSDKTCLVTEILSVTSNEGLKLLIQLLYIITNIIKKLWALVRLSFTQMEFYDQTSD